MPQNQPHANPPPDSITPLYQALLSPLGQQYYLQRFARFDDIGRSFPTWNWPASLVTLNWLLFRGLWGWALAYACAALGVVLLVFGIAKLVFEFSDATLHALLGVFLAAAFLLPGLYANALYYRHCKRRIADAILATTDNQQASQLLARQAPSPRRLWLLALVNLVLLAPLVALLVMFLNMQHGERLASTTAAGKAAAAGAALPAQPVASAAARATSASGRVDEGGIAPLQEKMATPPTSPQAAASAPASAAALAPAATGASAAASAPAAGFTSMTVAHAAASATRLPAPASAAVPGVSAAAIAPVSAAPRPASVPVAPPAKRPPPTATPSTAPPADAAAYFVDAGIYAQASNTQHAVEKLKAAQLPVVTEVLQMTRGERTRVRAGPFATQAQARQAAKSIEALGLPALLEPQPAASPKPAKGR